MYKEYMDDIYRWSKLLKSCKEKASTGHEW